MKIGNSKFPKSKQDSKTNWTVVQVHGWLFLIKVLLENKIQNFVHLF